MRIPKGYNKRVDTASLEDGEAADCTNARTYDDKEGLLGPRKGRKIHGVYADYIYGVIPIDISGSDSLIVANTNGSVQVKNRYPTGGWLVGAASTITVTGAVTLTYPALSTSGTVSFTPRSCSNANYVRIISTVEDLDTDGNPVYVGGSGGVIDLGITTDMTDHTGPATFKVKWGLSVDGRTGTAAETNITAGDSVIGLPFDGVAMQVLEDGSADGVYVEVSLDTWPSGTSAGTISVNIREMG